MAVNAGRHHSEQKTDWKNTRQLLLDSENPRFADAETTLQDDLVRKLWKEMAVDEVALSIAANGFFPEEPLLVIRAKASSRPSAKVDVDDGTAPDPKEPSYVVVEGNRRLAAVKLLLSATLREKVGAEDLPAISAKRKKELEELPVSIYKSREELWEFFGFRHINGPKPWDAFAKAKFVADVHENYGIAIEEIAHRIGDRHNTVLRFYRGYLLVRQAIDEKLFARDDIYRKRFYFSHLYTAVDQPEYQKFLGLTAASWARPHPVAKAKLAHLRELLEWMYGSRSKGLEPIVETQNPDLNVLREVLASPPALAALRSGMKLKSAHEISIGDQRRFREALVRAKTEMQQAKATVTTGYDGNPTDHDLASDISKNATALLEEMDGIQSGTKRRKR